MKRFLCRFSWINLLLMVLGLIGLSGCSTYSVRPDDPEYAPVYEYPQESESVAQNGSLFQSSVPIYLYQDEKASRVGDIITVILTESTNAQKNTDTALKKENDITFANPTVAGKQITFDNGQKSFELGISGANEFKSEADAAQSNSLNGTISVTVHKILPNGNLLVRGEKWLTLNQGNEYIRLSGIIRPKDVSSDNSIQSTRMANARIQYSGTGPLAENNERGWLSRFFNSGWWPF